MKIGILGGGQLGLMFQQNASNYPIDIHYMDSNPNSPVSQVCNNFKIGDITNYEDVMEFGKDKDVISIEIEHVNLEALSALKEQGKRIVPDPETLRIIRDKGTQRKFYSSLDLPSPSYEVYDEWEDLELELDYPVFQKYRTGGYDGKGVMKISNSSELDSIHRTPSIFEEAVEIDKEIAVQVFKSSAGDLISYPSVKFHADEELNLLDYLIFPGNFGESQEKEAKKIAETIAENLPGAGVFSVELFLSKSGQLIVNETAPRVHNSGHSTIEASPSSQFDQFLRILAELPLSKSQNHRCSGILNLLGPENVEGEVFLDGLDEVLAQPETYLHWYQKKISKPGRKLGHLSFLGENEAEVVNKINFAKASLKIISR